MKIPDSLPTWEYMVTNGDDWQWHVLPSGEAFHLHTMATYEGELFAGTGAWAGRILRSQDQGKTWQVIYEHPTPNRQVSRVTELTSLDDGLYASITALQEDGIKLLRGHSDGFEPVAGWPVGKRVSDLTAYDDWLYGINLNPDDSGSLWRTRCDRTERVTGLDGHRVRALAVGPDALWAITQGTGQGGFLLHSTDGSTWTAVYQFSSVRPLDVAVYGGSIYVGGRDETNRGILLGPAAPASAGKPTTRQALPPATTPLSPQQLQNNLQQIDRVIADPTSYASGNAQATLSQALLPLALSGLPEAGEALSQHLKTTLPAVTARLFDDVVAAPATDVVQWYLLWAIGLNGHGHIPTELLTIPWAIPSNSREKYWQPAPAAVWVVSQLGQTDPDTLASLIDRLTFDEPAWLKGDTVGALSTLTGEQFGYDATAWQAWWTNQTNSSD